MSFIQSVTLIKQDSASRMSPLERKKLKLIARVREQIELAENAAYVPMHEKRIKREDGSTAVIEVPKRRGKTSHASDFIDPGHNRRIGDVFPIPLIGLPADGQRLRCKHDFVVVEFLVSRYPIG